MKQKLTLIKLGGSIITNKEVPMMVRADVLKQLVTEIVRAQHQTGGLYIVGHGQGSFAHAPALRYKTMDGFINEDSRMGMAVTQDSAAQLNRIVVQEFLAHSIPAVSFYFSNSMVTDSDKAKHWCGDVLEEYLAKGMVPITGGDVLVDSTKGCTIWSTEKILGYIAEHFIDSDKYSIQKIIHVTEVAGVLDASGAVIPHITEENIREVEKLIGVTKGFDVTGGMAHKIEESMKLAAAGMQVGIISGLKKDALFHSLIGDTVVGTAITK
jgi:isopentenyl phosphate kinase